MGWAAARGGPARAGVRAHAVAAEPRAGAGAVAGAGLARVAAPLQADVPLRDPEARERRPGVASPHGARLPLLDAAVAAVAGCVRAAAPGVDAPGHDAGNIRNRVGRALAHLRAIPLPPVAHRGVRVARARTARHRGHRELRVLQPARARAVRLAARRCHVAPVAASAASRGGAGAAVAAARHAHAGGGDRAALRARVRPGDRRDATAPPRYVRLVSYRYRFTTSADRSRSGAWWSREFVGYLTGALALPKTHAPPDSAAPPPPESRPPRRRRP